MYFLVILFKYELRVISDILGSIGIILVKFQCRKTER